jgi:hypothetical protein
LSNTDAEILTVVCTMVICDTRILKEFSKDTFSGYKTRDVSKAFEAALVSGELEAACYWAAELTCSGKASAVWETLCVVCAQHSFRAAPKYSILLGELARSFRAITNSGVLACELSIRDDEGARVCIARAVAAAVSATKGLPLKRIKVNPSDLALVAVPHRLRAPSTEFATVFKPGDPKALFVATNELAYATHVVHDEALASYWIEWAIAYAASCRRKKSPITCASRTSISEGHRPTDIAWLLWDVVLGKEADARKDRVRTALLTLFRLRYKAGTLNKRIHLLYCAVSVASPSFALAGELSLASAAMATAETSVPRMYSLVEAGAARVPQVEPPAQYQPETPRDIDLLLSTVPFKPKR